MNRPEITRVSLRHFLHTVFKRKTQALLFFCATMVTVPIGSLLAKPTYEATPQILLKIGSENLYVPTVLAEAHMGQEALDKEL